MNDPASFKLGDVVSFGTDVIWCGPNDLFVIATIKQSGSWNNDGLEYGLSSIKMPHIVAETIRETDLDYIAMAIHMGTIESDVKDLELI